MNINAGNKFRHESLQDRETIADLLASLQQGLSKGELTFSDENNAITLKPEGLLSLVIKASGGSELNVLEVRIAWQSGTSKKMNKSLTVTADQS